MAEPAEATGGLDELGHRLLRGGRRLVRGLVLGFDVLLEPLWTENQRLEKSKSSGRGEHLDEELGRFLGNAFLRVVVDVSDTEAGDISVRPLKVVDEAWEATGLAAVRSKGSNVDPTPREIRPDVDAVL